MAARVPVVIGGVNNIRKAPSGDVLKPEYLSSQGSDIASAGTIVFGDGTYYFITGTTTITDIDLTTERLGGPIFVKFSGILVLTHSSTLILPNAGSNITTAAGDTAIFISEGSDVVRCLHYQRASGSGGGSGAVATDVIFDAKGDLAVGTGSDTAAKLTVGANNTILMADSSQTTGTKWASGSVARPALGIPRTLFAYTTDSTTSGTTEQVLYTDTMAANQLAAVKDRVVFEWSGDYAFNANVKRHRIYAFGGASIFDNTSAATITSAGLSWHIFGYGIRVSNSVVRTCVTLVNEEFPSITQYNEVTGLDLAATGYEIACWGRSLTAAGGLTARGGAVEFKPFTT